MKLNLKLMGGLKGKHPEELEVPDGSSVNDVIQILELEKLTGAVTVNGAVQVDRSAALVDGDEVLILGLVGGG
jgi:sulfur carrier protein ThiS